MRHALAAFLLVFACSAWGQAKIFRHASQFDPGSMDPHAVASTYNARILNQVYESLVGRDERFRIEPRLALSWTAVEGGWRLPYYLPSVVCRTPLGAALGRAWRALT